MANRFVRLTVTGLIGVTCALSAQSPPRLPYENWGACPFECCVYRTWTVVADTDILTDRRDDAPRGFVVTRGTRVVGVTGVVVTHQFGRAVAQRERTIGRRRVAVRSGEQILLMHYIGEGFWKYWLRGELDEEFIPDPENCERSAHRSPTMFAQCAVQVQDPPKTTWWVKIRNRSGQEGWTRHVEHFGNVDACGAPEGTR